MSSCGLRFWCVTSITRLTKRWSGEEELEDLPLLLEPHTHSHWLERRRNVKFVVSAPRYIFIELKCFFDISGGPASCSAFMFVWLTFFSIAPSKHDDMMGIIKIQLRLPKMGWRRAQHTQESIHSLLRRRLMEYKKNVMKIVVIVQRRMSMTEEEGGQCRSTSNIFGQSILLCNFFFYPYER